MPHDAEYDIVASDARAQTTPGGAAAQRCNGAVTVAPPAVTAAGGGRMLLYALADPAVCFGGGQLGEVTQARVPPKLKTPRIWPTIE